MGWVIKSGNGSAYRNMEQGNLTWTDNYQKALHFFRREDAERFAFEDEDAWSVEFIPYDITDNTGFFNQLSPGEAERLWLLVEEMGEALQAIGKIGRHGYESTHPEALVGDSNNRGDLQKELGHVLRIIDMLRLADDINRIAVMKASDEKVISMRPYLHHQGKGN